MAPPFRPSTERLRQPSSALPVHSILLARRLLPAPCSSAHRRLHRKLAGDAETGQLVQRIDASKDEMRQEMRELNSGTRREMRDLNDETRRQMRVLHEDLVERIKILGESR